MPPDSAAVRGGAVVLLARPRQPARSPGARPLPALTAGLLPVSVAVFRCGCTGPDRSRQRGMSSSRFLCHTMIV